MGDREFLEYLAEQTESLDNWIFREESDDNFYLALTNLTRKAEFEEVWACASNRVQELSGALKFTRRLVEPLKLGRVIYRHEDGTLDQSICLPADAFADLSPSAVHLRIWRNGGRTAQPREETLLQKFALLMQADPLVAKALRLTELPDADIWTGLYRLGELIQEDLKLSDTDLFERGWTSKKEWGCFRRTANSSAAGDASRHGAANEDPPDRPMQLQEARELLQRVMDGWLEYRLALAETACNNSLGP
ncbi:hypothetical protein [Xylophilus ampelinus]|uniref:hypothetical protein n=1 Tax=Xylophilus ampelinus TaxID=54067 RepID=UPI000D7BE8D3|nr:hypothetical protein [Xylophilus ampelinus]MCS4511508.1 hypothetical protein [Xylophilus ampelinus]